MAVLDSTPTNQAPQTGNVKDPGGAPGIVFVKRSVLALALALSVTFVTQPLAGYAQPPPSEIVLISAPAGLNVGDSVSDPRVVAMNGSELSEAHDAVVTQTWVEATGGSCFPPVPGTRAIASVADEGFFGADNGSESIFFRTSFTLPAGLSSPSILFTATADDRVEVLLNGISIGAIEDYGTDLCDPQSSFTYTNPASFSAGENVVELRLFNFNAPLPLSLSYRLVVSFTPPQNQPPDCSSVTAIQAMLWPPNHKLRLVTLGGATDPDGDTVTLRITAVTQDEPLNGLGDGDISPDARAAAQPNKVLLRAERSGRGDGRVYRVSFTGSDGKGGSCSGVVTVGVPHDMGAGSTTIDSAPPSFDSFGP